MPPELEAHGGEQLAGEISFAARGEAREERGAQHRRGHRFVDGGGDSPAPFARIRDAAGEIGELWALEQRDGRQVQQLGGDDAAAAPEFSDVGEV